LQIRKANSTLAGVAARGDYAARLNPDERDATKLAYLFEPPADNELVMFAVNTIVSNARNEGPQCIEPKRELF
jgi:hypothetical protein